MKVYGQFKYRSIHFSFSVLDAGERSTAQPDGCTSKERALCSHCIEDLKMGLTSLPGRFREDKNILPLQGKKVRRLDHPSPDLVIIPSRPALLLT